MKILRLQDLMNWFEDQFNAKIVYLIRHPIAVALSREFYPRLPLFLKNAHFCRDYLTPESVRLGNEILDRGSELERKVLDWGFQNLPPLQKLKRSNWCCIHYEHLVMEPEEILNRLVDYLNLKDPEAARVQVGRASDTVSKSDLETRRFFAGQGLEEGKTFLLQKWKKRVSRGDMTRVQRILDVLEINTYRATDSMPVNPLG